MSVVMKYIFMTVFIIGLSGCSTTKYNVSIPDNLDPKFKQLVNEQVHEDKKVEEDIIIKHDLPVSAPEPKPITTTKSFERVNTKTILEKKRTTTKTNTPPQLEPEKEIITENEVVTKDTVALKSKYNTIFLISVIQSIVVFVLGIYLLRKNKL